MEKGREGKVTKRIDTTVFSNLKPKAQSYFCTSFPSSENSSSKMHIVEIMCGSCCATRVGGLFKQRSSSIGSHKLSHFCQPRRSAAISSMFVAFFLVFSSQSPPPLIIHIKERCKTILCWKKQSLLKKRKQCNIHTTLSILSLFSINIGFNQTDWFYQTKLVVSFFSGKLPLNESLITQFVHNWTEYKPECNPCNMAAIIYDCCNLCN